MQPISYARHRFPPSVIQHAVWLYLRFTLNYRDVEDLLAERALDVSYETVRRWVAKFGTVYAGRLRRSRDRPLASGTSMRWSYGLAASTCTYGGLSTTKAKVLNLLIQRRRDKKAALRLLRKLLRKLGFAPAVVATDKLRSYGAAFRTISRTARHEPNRPDGSP